MTAGCAPIAVDGVGGIAAMLRTVDCHTNLLVGQGYARLFGTGGVFGAVLTAALTIYIALLAYRLLMGRTSLSLTTITPRVLAMGLVLTFATSWPAYQTMVFDLLTRGPEQIAGVLAGSPGGATQGFVQRLDVVFGQLMDTAMREAGSAPKGPGALNPITLLSYSAMILLLGTIGVLVVAKTILAILLAIGPLFILMALYGGTRGLFEGWLRTSVLFAIAPMLTILVGSAAIAMLAPVIAAVTSPQGAVTMRMAMTLFAGSIIYGALLLLAFRTAVSITGSWKIPGLTPHDGTMPATANPAPAIVPAGGSAASGSSSERISTIVAAVGGSDAAAGPSRSAALATVSTPAASAGDAPQASEARTPAASRGRGLGQSFRGRTQASRQNLSGAIGA